MALTNKGRDMNKACDKKVTAANCILDWRADATKVFLHATDEDSDLPTVSSYYAKDQGVDDAFCV
jgi:hypothetical protein